MQKSLAVNQEDLFGSALTFRKPFLKWAGGKFRVLGEILPRMPSGSRLVEPFAGSGVVALNADFPEALVADVNVDLINLYHSIKYNPEKFCQEAEKLFAPANNRRESFDRLRDEFNRIDDPFRRSVIFVYLNRHAFNGLCRYNAKGLFNVPFGKYKNPGFPVNEIRAFSLAARRMTFVNQGYEATMSQARRGDVIYCDPPYVPLSLTSNFTSYAPGSFGLEEQRRLAGKARECAAKGISVLISNHDTPISRELYSGAEIHSFDVQRFISSKSSTRGKAPELLAIFRG